MLGEWGVWAQRPLLVGHGSNDRKTAEKKHKQRLDFNPAKIKVSDNSAAMVSAHGTKTALWISASWNDSIECQIWPNRPIPSAHSLSLHVDLPSPHEFLRQPRKPGLRTTIHKVKPRHGRATDAWSFGPTCFEKQRTSQSIQRFLSVSVLNTEIRRFSVFFGTLLQISGVASLVGLLKPTSTNSIC